jgi:uncharacterized membrane protein
VKKREYVPVVLLAVVCASLWFVPPVETVVDDNAETSAAEVVEVDDSRIEMTGLLEYGTQYLTVELPDGTRRRAENELRAQLDLDKKFKVGDRALVVLGEEPLIARDRYRLGWMAAVFAAFSALLLVFCGWTGAKALFSFVFSCFIVWKLLVPMALSGYSASWVAFLSSSVLAAVIAYLVAGPTRKGAAAFLGTMLGMGSSLLLAHFLSRVMHVDGAAMPFVQALIYSGYQTLDLADLFVGATILASSGAVMDLAMDIAVGVHEVRYHNPSLSRSSLFMSGIRMGRAVVGTMVTTLLLAYSGGYITLLMVFAAQGTSPLDFLNTSLVSAEIVKTIVGSFGLVLVAPFTAFVSAWIFTLARRCPVPTGHCGRSDRLYGRTSPLKGK